MAELGAWGGRILVAVGVVAWSGCGDGARQPGGPEAVGQAQSALGGSVCGSVALNTDSPASPSAAGTSVTLSATASCTGGTPMYAFYLEPVGGSWTQLCGYSPSSTCSWNAPSAGAYYIQATAVSSLSTASTDSSSAVEEHQVGSSVCGSVALNADSPASPSAAGTTVTLSATATCTGGTPGVCVLRAAVGGLVDAGLRILPQLDVRLDQPERRLLLDPGDGPELRQRREHRLEQRDRGAPDRQ